MPLLQDAETLKHSNIKLISSQLNYVLIFPQQFAIVDDLLKRMPLFKVLPKII